MEKIKIRGLARISAFFLAAWGTVVTLKSLHDLFIGEPEANLYAPKKWAFVTQEQWLRYGGFELAYGLSCLALAWVIFRYAEFLPNFIERESQPQDFQLFD